MASLGNNGGRFYSFLNRPVLVDCNFTVDATNGNGLGIRSLKGSGVRNAYMATSASFTGTYNNSINVTAISGGTSSLVVGMPVSGTGITAGSKIASIVSSSAVTLTLATTGGSTTGAINYVGIGNPMLNTNTATASNGLIWLQLRHNYARYAGGFSGFVSPSTGGTVAINSTSLTVGNPYIIASVGHAAAGAITIAPVADSSGSLASTYFTLFDQYGNTYVMWFYVTGVGGNAPVGVSGIPIQVTIAENATAGNVTTAISNVVLALSSTSAPGINLPASTAPFTESGAGGATLTLTSTQTNPYGPLPGAPQDGAGSLATTFTFAATIYKTNQQNWNNVGLPKGVIPAVGAGFVASATGDSANGGSTGTVVAVGVSSIGSIEVIGDANQTFSPSPMGGTPNAGGWILVQCLAPVVTVPVTSGTSGNAVTLNAGTTLEATGGGTIAATTTMTRTAPANNSVVGMSFYVDLSATTIDGD